MGVPESREERVRGVCFFGGYVEGYPRSAVLKSGLEKHGIAVHSCRVSHKKKFISRYVALVFQYLFSKRDFSVIYVPEFRHKDVPLAWLLGKLTRKIVVFDPLVSRFDTKVRDRGDVRERSFQAWHNRNLDRLSLFLPDLVLADTRAHADYYVSEHGASAKRMQVLPVGFDDDLFDAALTAKLRDDGERFKVLFFGSYLPLHGVSTIVEAARLLRSRPQIEFELIGNGQTFPQIEEFVKREKLENVQLAARLPIDFLPERIAGASVCLGIFGLTEKASRVVPNKVYQCMGMGKAVITSRSRAILEHFTDGEHICLVPAGDPEALAEKIAYLAAHPEVRLRIASSAGRLLQERYRSDHVAEKFLSYCEEVSS